LQAQSLLQLPTSLSTQVAPARGGCAVPAEGDPLSVLEDQRISRQRSPKGTVAAEKVIATSEFVASDREPVDVAAIVVTYNSSADIDALLASLRAEAGQSRIRLIVVDNGSADDTAERVRRHSDITLIAAPGNGGYAAGINIGRRAAGTADALLILNPDCVVLPGALIAMRERLREPGVGAVVPTLLDADGMVYPSLRREPTIVATLGDSLLGKRFSGRPAWASETCWRRDGYRLPRRIDWATGAALLIDPAADARVGDWDESFFLYSEETDFFRRLRDAGYQVWYEPAASIVHRRGGSGADPTLAALLAVNRVRYIAKRHGRLYTAGFSAAAATGEALRIWEKGHRLGLRSIFEFGAGGQAPSVQAGTPKESAAPAVLHPGGIGGVDQEQLGSVIIPAHDEAAVIGRTLRPLGPLAESGSIELIVVPNGCCDATAEIARTISGTRVLDQERASKAAALNLGDQAATRWPRFYLDADIKVPASALRATARAMAMDGLLAARPSCRYDVAGGSCIVRAFYRARAALPSLSSALWGAGIYAISQSGHQRLPSFPDLMGDDLWVDQLFGPAEKRVVESEPVVVQGPRTTAGLLAILRRSYRGNGQVQGISGYSSTKATARELSASVHGPRSLLDAAVYAAVVVFARIQLRVGRSQQWDRDESSRTGTSPATSTRAPKTMKGTS
jgi:GT2 family glycosyltransferase